MTVQSGPSDQRPRKLSPPTGTPAYNCNFEVCLWPRNSSFCEIIVALTSISVCYRSPTLTYLLQLVKLIGTISHSPLELSYRIENYRDDYYHSYPVDSLRNYLFRSIFGVILIAIIDLFIKHAYFVIVHIVLNSFV